MYVRGGRLTLVSGLELVVQCLPMLSVNALRCLAAFHLLLKGLPMVFLALLLLFDLSFSSSLSRIVPGGRHTPNVIFIEALAVLLQPLGTLDRPFEPQPFGS